MPGPWLPRRSRRATRNGLRQVRITGPPCLPAKVGLTVFPKATASLLKPRAGPSLKASIGFSHPMRS
ncbi:DUF1581 domain-containing protein [Mesorhizobium sp. B2-4-9]|nr:DUF1581 domain-containing protein [Mesorhizobium sp. B2-5-2]TPL18936.1 DUF1581 domain-containing protein [Mesorhizobium sp. B2-4-9]TPL19241.1 DUF1581 domain-containing protein [Mesorhizobium sp. B2-4-7]TPL34418.1 DUF1581 domain-containing protein [Mesorhizobium sp. B2-4-5]TPM70015.1 DUF1581 domain-containing protein [Mesorhizobium sp. B2-1-6]TPN73103.1 DUF1581 domain-containing protein [Mesorhizobium sp. B1-1-2]